MHDQNSEERVAQAARWIQRPVSPAGPRHWPHADHARRGGDPLCRLHRRGVRPPDVRSDAQPPRGRPRGTHRHRRLALPGNDFWLIDDRIVRWNLFSGDGQAIEPDHTEDPSVAKLCAEAFRAVWDLATDHADYRI